MNRARLASDILTNPLWKETFEELGHYYYDAFRESTNSEEKEKIAIANDLLDDFQSFLESAINDGIKLRNVGDNNE